MDVFFFSRMHNYDGVVIFFRFFFFVARLFLLRGSFRLDVSEGNKSDAFLTRGRIVFVIYTFPQSEI